MTPYRALLLALLSPLCLLPQDRVNDHNAHGWFNYFGDHPISDSKWGLHLEGQYRRHNVITQWQQLLLRPGVNYQLTPKGKSQLAELNEYWKYINTTIGELGR